MTETETYSSKIIARKIEGGGVHLFVICKLLNNNYLMLIDTGASNTVFDATNPIFDKLNFIMPQNQEKSYGINSQIENVKVAKLPDFKIGKLDMCLRNAIFIDLSNLNRIYESMKYQKIIGIIGCDLLQKYKTVIDLENKKLIFKIKKNKPLIF